jgi:hypothetical protein
VRLILCPSLPNSTARTRKLLQGERKGDIGSPRLVGLHQRLEVADQRRIGLGQGLAPPALAAHPPVRKPLRRRQILQPRPIVERATPVARETAAIPPRPNAFASLAVWSRRSRSFKTSQSASWRTDIDSLSIMPQAIPQAQNRESLSHPRFDRSRTGPLDTNTPPSLQCACAMDGAAKVLCVPYAQKCPKKAAFG